MVEIQPQGQQPEPQRQPANFPEGLILDRLNSIRSTFELAVELGPLLPEEQWMIHRTSRLENNWLTGEAFLDLLDQREPEGLVPQVSLMTGEQETYLQRRTRWNGEHIGRFEKALSEADERYDYKSPEEQAQIRKELERELDRLRKEQDALQVIPGIEEAGGNELSPEDTEYAIKVLVDEQEPTEEELAQTDPEFTERVIRRTLDRIHREGDKQK